MGIQINGQTDRISAVDGSFSIQDLAEVNVTGVATASNFKSGTSNVHSTGYNGTNINVTGIVTAASANFTGNVSVGGTLTYQDVTNIDSVGVITARAGVKVPDSQKIFLGTGDDLQIYHDGSHTYANNTTGYFHIRSGSEIRLQKTGGERMIYAIPDGAVEFYYDDVKKFETHADGLHIGDGGNLDMPHDSSKIVMGASDDLQIYHDGSHSYLSNATGNLFVEIPESQKFQIQHGSEAIINGYADGRVELYYDNAKKLETKSDGIDVTGEVQCDSLDVDGASSFTRSGSGTQDVADFYNGTSGGHTRVKVRTVANSGGDPFIFFDGGGTNFVVGEQWNGTTNNILRLGAGNDMNTVAGMFITASGHCVPDTNNGRDLGTTSNRWRNIYTNDLNLSNEGSTNDVDGTWGNYTIQEGENDLFLINKRNGKKYKFNLTEVN